MKIRAVICDIYRTLLEVLPPHANAEAEWIELWGDFIGGHPPLTLHELGVQCEKVVVELSRHAHKTGITHPEERWDDAMLEVIPELARLSPEERVEFILHETGLWHAVRLMPGAAKVLRFLCHRGVALGIESNCQPYTLFELNEALASTGLTMDIFEPRLRFLSFENGFCKPDPHVFRLLAARLRLLDIRPDETLVVGDHVENDIKPARAQGFHAWRLTHQAHGLHTGDWKALHQHLLKALR